MCLSSELIEVQGTQCRLRLDNRPELVSAAHAFSCPDTGQGDQCALNRFG